MHSSSSLRMASEGDVYKRQIRDKEVRLIGADGTMLGVVPGLEARRMAEEQELDLVKISPNAVPPCLLYTSRCV